MSTLEIKDLSSENNGNTVHSPGALLTVLPKGHAVLAS